MKAGNWEPSPPIHIPVASRTLPASNSLLNGIARLDPTFSSIERARSLQRRTSETTRRPHIKSTRVPGHEIDSTADEHASTSLLFHTCGHGMQTKCEAPVKSVRSASRKIRS